MPKIEKQFGDVTLSFGPLKVGYMKANQDLLKTAVVKSGLDDLVAQTPLVEHSLVAGGMKSADAAHTVEDLAIPDLYEAVIAAMEASGFSYQRTAAPGEGSPAGA